MIKRKIKKKLILNKESIAILNGREIKLIKGGEFSPSRACKTLIINACVSDQSSPCEGGI
jgi:hypothetical protein